MLTWALDRIEHNRITALSFVIRVVEEAIKKYQGPEVNCDTYFDSKQTEKNSACDALQASYLSEPDISR